MRGQDLYRAIDAVDDKYIDQVYKDQTKRRKPLSKRKMYLALIAAIMALAILTVGAAEVYEWDGRLSQLLGLSSDQRSYVDGMWYRINETISKDGISLSLDSVLADSNSMFVLYELSLPESMDMDRYYDFEIQQLDGQDWYSLGGSLSGSISSRLVDLDKQKRTMTYMMEFSASSGDIREQKMRFSFKDLYSYRIVDDEIIDKRLEAKLDFVFYSMLSYTPNLVNYEPGKKISGKHNTVWIDRITITPISLTIGARAEGGYSFWDEERTEREGSFVTAIILNDGSRVETRDSSTSVNIFDQVSYKTIYDGIVNPKDIQQIEFFGQDTLYLGDLDYTNDTKASLDARRLADLTFNMGIFISIISMLISIISMLYLCKSDIYLSFERVQARKKKKGREYSFDQYLALTNKVLLKTAVAYRFFLVLLLLGIGWLTYMIISNCFVTMTVFVDILLIGLTLLLFITIKEIGRFRRRLTKL